MKSPRNRFLGTVMLLGFAFRLWAAGPTPQDNCQQAQNQRELTACWGHVAKDAEKSLSETYEKAVARLQAGKMNGALELLKRAQVKWESYRDAQCATVSKLYEGGSAESMEEASCRARLANQRKDDLNIMLADWGTEAKDTPN